MFSGIPVLIGQYSGEACLAVCYAEESEVVFMTWVLLVLAYGIIKGMREVLKKKALETSSTFEVLFLYTFISFLIVTPEIRNAGGLPAGTLLFIAAKSFVIFVAWMAGFTAVRNMPVGLYGLLDQSRVVFAMLLGLIILRESMGWAQIAGLVLVVAGLVMLRFTPSDTDGTGISDGKYRARAKFIAFTLISAFLNAVSGTFDKMLMSDGTLTDGQLQFWYMLFLTVYYALFILITRPEFNVKRALKNKWIWILAVLFVIADRLLFIANGNPDSRVTVMTLIKQSCCIVTVIGGRLVFKEKHTGYRLICAGIVLGGIVVSVIW